MDQAEPQNQKLPRHYEKRRHDADMDRPHPLSAAFLHQVHQQMSIRHHGTGKPSPRHAHVRLRPARSPQSEQGHAEETSRLECP